MAAVRGVSLHRPPAHEQLHRRGRLPMVGGGRRVGGRGRMHSLEGHTATAGAAAAGTARLRRHLACSSAHGLLRCVLPSPLPSLQVLPGVHAGELRWPCVPACLLSPAPAAWSVCLEGCLAQQQQGTARLLPWASPPTAPCLHTMPAAPFPQPCPPYPCALRGAGGPVVLDGGPRLLRARHQLHELPGGPQLRCGAAGLPPGRPLSVACDTRLLEGGITQGMAR